MDKYEPLGLREETQANIPCPQGEVMSEDRCPFCGAEPGMKDFWKCGCYLGCYPDGRREYGWYKDNCLKNQLATQADLLRRTAEVVEGLKSECENRQGKQCPVCCQFGKHDGCVIDDADKLLPQLKRLVGEGK